MEKEADNQAASYFHFIQNLTAKEKPITTIKTIDLSYH